MRCFTRNIRQIGKRSRVEKIVRVIFLYASSHFADNRINSSKIGEGWLMLLTTESIHEAPKYTLRRHVVNSRTYAAKITQGLVQPVRYGVEDEPLMLSTRSAAQRDGQTKLNAMLRRGVRGALRSSDIHDRS